MFQPVLRFPLVNGWKDRTMSSQYATYQSPFSQFYTNYPYGGVHNTRKGANNNMFLTSASDSYSPPSGYPGYNGNTDAYNANPFNGDTYNGVSINNPPAVNPDTEKSGLLKKSLIAGAVLVASVLAYRQFNIGERLVGTEFVQRITNSKTYAEAAEWLNNFKSRLPGAEFVGKQKDKVTGWLSSFWSKTPQATPA
jgi:hypothetical protein